MRQNDFFAEVIKTDIINVDESTHRLPPHNGAYQEFKVANYFCPEEWSNDGIFIPVKEGDPLWFDFRGNDECAILCAVQRINPITGEPADLEEGLIKDPAQNYLRMPEQKWLDGYAKEGKVYQFVVTKAGIGLAVNEYVLPKHMQDSHAIGFAFFGPKNPKPKPVSYNFLNTTVTVTMPQYTLPSSKAKSKHWVSGDGGQYFSGTDFGCAGGNTVMRGLANTGNSINAVTGDGEAQIFCCNSTEVETKKEQCVYSADSIEVVDVLTAQANLSELDKASMGAGGRIQQNIETDENTTDYYHEKRSALLTIYFALPEMYDAIMKKGKRQDSSRKDKYKTSGHIGGVAVPLINQKDQ